MPNKNKLISLLLAGLILAVGLWASARTDDGQDLSTRSSTAESAAVTATEGDRFSTLETIRVTELPVEGRETLRLITTGGPFPFDRDGVTFQNREGILPPASSGHYQEYTVITPGSSDRGARRVVAGQDGERYYTDDHYSSFREIVTDTEDQP